MHNKRHLALVSLLLLLPLCLTGCWDVVEMEERAFVIGMGIDEGSKPGQLKLTYQIAVPRTLASGGQGGGAGDPYFTITAEGQNFYLADRAIAASAERVLDLEHLQVIVFGEGFARAGIDRVVDPLLRSPQVRRRTTVFVSRGEAKNVFQVKPFLEATTAMYMAGMIESNEPRTFRVSAAVDLGRIAENIRRQSDYAIARVTPGERALKGAGAAVFKQYHMIGWLGEVEATALKLLRGEITPGATVVFPSRSQMAGLVTLLVSSGHTTVKPVFRDGKVVFDVEIKMMMDLAAVENLNFDASNEAFLRQAEQDAARHIEKICQTVFKKTQSEEFQGTDIFEFGRLTRNYHYRWWLENEKNWDEFYRNAELDVKVTLQIQRILLIR